MILLEPIEDGFTISLDGRRILSHSARSPLFELGSAEPVVRQRKGSFTLRQKRRTRVKARAWKQVSAREDFIDIEFEGLIRLSVREVSGALHLTFSRYDSAFNRFMLRLPATPGESIFGCGEQFSRLDLKGSRVPLWSEEKGMGRGKDLITLAANIWGRAGGYWHTSYFGQPSFVSSEGLYAHIRTSAYCVFDFRRPRLSTLCSWALPEEIVIGLRASAPACVEALSALLGRQPALPAWIWDGAWLDVSGGLSEMGKKLDTVKNAGIKPGAVCVMDWNGGQRQGSRGFNQELYPNLPDTIAKLRRDGLRFLGYISPFIVPDGPMYDEASKAGFCVKKHDGSDYLVSHMSTTLAMVDLYNPAAFSWIKEIIKQDMIGIGMAGWLADAGEYLPVDAMLYGGRDPLMAHNEYPVLWARANAEAVRESGKEGQLAYMLRSGWAGSSAQSAAFFSGEQLVNWSESDGLASVIPAALSLGFSGIGAWHAGIGGHAGPGWIKRSRECLMRWTELAAFTPIMRTQEGRRPERNAQVWSDPATLAHFARMSTIWAALAPYHAEAMDQYQSGGLPPIRHTWLHYQDQPELRTLSYQYMYGRDILVAPVTRPGKDLARAVLPSDAWVHLWTSREFRGGDVTIEAPLGYPPVFYRAESQWSSLFESLRRSVKKL